MISPLKRNYLTTLAANAALAVLGLATGSLAARMLGPTGRGELAAIQNIPMQLLNVAALGIPNALTFFAARHPERTRSLFSTGLIIGLVGSLPIVVAGYLLMPLALAEQTAVVVSSARRYLIYVPMAVLFSFPLWALHGASRFATWNVLRLAPAGAWLVVLLLSVSRGSTAEALATGSLVAYLFLIPFSLCAFFWSTSGDWRPSRELSPQLFRYGIPSVLSSVPQQVNFRLDQILMAALLSPSHLGLYAVAVSWSNAGAPLLSALGASLLPRLASDPNADVRRYVRMAGLLTIGTSGALLLVTPVGLPLLFGEPFRQANAVALVLVVASGFAGFNGVLEEVLRGLGLPTWPLRAQVAGLLPTVLLLGLLLEEHGAMGAALASLGSYLTTSCVLVTGLFRKVGGNLGALVPGQAELLEFRSLVWPGFGSRGAGHE
jgi:O-antigen/teichoic acid export membrane protein